MNLQAQDKVGKLWWREGKLHQVRVSIDKGSMTVQKRNAIAIQLIETTILANEKTVKIKKAAGRLGMDIQGGLGAGKPLQITAINEGSTIDKSGSVLVDDILLHVNGEPMLNQHLSAVKKFIQDIPIDTVIELHIATVNPIVDTGDDEVSIPLERKEQFRRAIGDGAWLSVHDSSLAASLITSYQKGNNIPMPNTMSIGFSGGKNTLLLHSSPHDPDSLKEWTEIISAHILEKNREEIQTLKQNFDLSDLILFGWVFERVQSSQVSTVWLKKFLVLRKKEIQLYHSFPETAEDWQRHERSYNLVNVFVRPVEDVEIPNLRSCSVLIQTPTENHIISFEYPTPYHCWVQSIHHHRCLAVMELKDATFKGSWNKRYVNFILDLDQGFMVEDHTTKVVYWQRQFSDLVESSDNGHSILHLQFKENHTESIELRDITGCVLSMEAFMSAKLHQKEY